MQAFAIALSLALCIPRVLGQFEPTSFNTTFDNGSIRIADTVCANSTILAPYTTWGDIPTFRNFHGIAGAGSVGRSPELLCGQCILFEYINNGVIRAGYAVLVDVTEDYFPELSWEKAHILTGLTQEEYLAANITMAQLTANLTYCGLARVPHGPTGYRQATREQVIGRLSRKEGRRERFRETLGMMLGDRLEEII